MEEEEVVVNDMDPIRGVSEVQVGNNEDSLGSIKLNSLKQLIDSHLRKNNTYAEIRHFVAEFSKASKVQDQDPRFTQGNILDAVRERKVIEDIIQSLETQPNLSSGEVKSERKKTAEQAAELGKQYLHVRVLGGRSFGTGVGNKSGSMLKLFLHYGDQRFESLAVAETEDPSFDASFLVRISSNFSFATGSKSEVSRGLESLLKMGHGEGGDDSHSNDLHLVIVRVGGGEDDNIDSTPELVASHRLGWRRVLASNSGGATVTVELSGMGPAAKVRTPVGVLDVRLDLVPNVVNDSGEAPKLLSKKQVDSSLRQESQFHAEMHRRFAQYARIWWDEYVQVDSRFRTRLVKIFAENEWGEHCPVTTYVRPYNGHRLIGSPMEAARFVSLIPYVRDEVVGGGRMEIWYCIHSILCKRHGDVEDHATLLCSLLLGFGLNAYVCIGTVKDREDGPERDHVWVLSISGKRGKNCVFWESLTGQRFVGKENVPYSRVSCVFNHESFYGNKQVDDRVSRCHFDLTDDQRWKAMDERLLVSLRASPVAPLLAPIHDELKVAEAIECTIKGLVESERREQYSLSTSWDKQMSYFLSTALSSYETERCTGVLTGEQEFQAVIKRHIPEGHTFKGFPLLLHHRDPNRIFYELRQSAVGSDILKSRADHVHFACRVRVYPYADNFNAVWVMLAVRFRAS